MIFKLSYSKKNVQTNYKNTVRNIFRSAASTKKILFNTATNCLPIWGPFNLVIFGNKSRSIFFNVYMCGYKYGAALIAGADLNMNYRFTFNYKFLWYQINALSVSVKTI